MTHSISFIHSLPANNSTLLEREVIIDEYCQFTRRYWDISETTVEEQTTYLERFLRTVNLTWRADKKLDLEPDTIKQFLLAYGKRHGPGSRKWMNYSLRSFLRFAQFQKYLDRDLTPIVYHIRKRKLTHVPHIITDDQIHQLLTGIDCSTHMGMRDYAIIQLFLTYGVRGIQIRTLKLADLHWRTDEIHFPAAKRGFPIVQPLTAEVGKSLVTYLTKARPQHCTSPEVFVSVRSPFQLLKKSGCLSSIIARRLKAAGIELPAHVTHGGHLFRHAFASRMLQQKQPLKHIADMLGHRDPSSTFIYTKIDMTTLREATLEWPEVTI